MSKSTSTKRATPEGAKRPGRASLFLLPADREAVQEIIDAGYAHSFTTAVRFGLQRAIRFVRSQKAA